MIYSRESAIFRLVETNHHVVFNKKQGKPNHICNIFKNGALIGKEIKHPLYVRSGWPYRGKLVGGSPTRSCEGLDVINNHDDPYAFDENDDYVLEQYKTDKQGSPKEICRDLIMEIVIKVFELGKKRKLETIFDFVLSDQNLFIPELNREDKLNQIFNNVLKEPVVMKKPKKSLDEIFGNVLSTCKPVSENMPDNED